MAKSVFYSFHYDNDWWRVNTIKSMGVIEGQPVLDSQDWESVKRQGEDAIWAWIKRQMAGKDAVVVLVGSGTASRPWVRREIAYAWDNHIPLCGVRIHGLKNQNGQTDYSGTDPFSQVSLKGGGTVADYVQPYNPNGRDSQAVYADIKNTLPSLVANAYVRS